MKFIKTELEGAYLIELVKIGDDRGYFSRAWCKETFAKQGLNSNIEQINTSYNAEAGTLRGLHYQAAPNAEVKIVQCIRGSIFDVIVDMRPDSPTYKQWFGLELKENSLKLLYVPEGFAHGYQATSDNSAILYPASTFYAPESEKGVRWDDPSIGIEWPMAPVNLSDKDKQWPLV